jgi:hypothetical protein
MPKGVREAGIPHIHVRTGLIALGQPADRLSVRLAKKAYYRCFGKFPRVTHRNPQWAPLRHVVRIVDAVADNGGTNAFVISSEANPIERLADRFTGKRAHAVPAAVLSQNFALALAQTPAFHLCLCILEHSELPEFPKIVKAIAPCMLRGGKIIGFYMSPSMTLLPCNDPSLAATVSKLPGPVGVHYAGSVQSAKVLDALQRAGGGRNKLVRAARLGLALLRIAPQALAANREEAAMHDEDDRTPPALCTSITLVVTISEQPKHNASTLQHPSWGGS